MNSDTKQISSLFQAIESCQSDDLVKILKSGIDCNLELYGSHALLVAVNMEEIKIIQTLLDFSANPNYVTSTYNFPLSRAISSHQFEITQFLLEHGANPNLQPLPSLPTPLIRAIRNGNVAITNLLLQHGAKPDLKYEPEEDLNKSPLQEAFEMSTQAPSCHLELIRLLIKKKANLNISFEGFTDFYSPLIGAIFLDHQIAQLQKNSLAEPHSYELTQLMLIEGADPKFKTFTGKTALQVAQELKTPQLTELLEKYI